MNCFLADFVGELVTRTGSDGHGHIFLPPPSSNHYFAFISRKGISKGEAVPKKRIVDIDRPINDVCTDGLAMVSWVCKAAKSSFSSVNGLVSASEY